jgi:hypothetical protein
LLIRIRIFPKKNQNPVKMATQGFSLEKKIPGIYRLENGFAEQSSPA